MSFDKHSNFNKQANFTEVKFGENKPVLEVELNELQQIQNEARANIVRDSIPSGFTQLGEIDYDYCLNNENKIKLKTDSVAYVNGYRINIPKDTIIDIGKAPEKDAREDLLFLEVWKEEVTSDSVLTKEGGEGQVEIPNNIKDSRYPIETTHRVALRWRIRHVADVDFNRYHMDGFSAGTNGRNRQVTAQGGSDKPFTPTFDTDATGSFNRSDLLHLNDKGLFVTSQNAKLFKTLDGYVYAIPMFRLYRKPSCGKSIPFEYSKINPKVDYNKFTKLMKEDKVERVITENIQGRSLVNLINSVIGDNLLNDSESYWGKSFTYVVNLKPNTLYTLIIDFELLDTSYAKLDSIMLGNSASISNAQSNYRLWEIPTGNNVIQFTTPSDYEPGNFRFVIEKSNSPNKPTLRLNNCMIVEGDLSNKEIPEFFTGLKSLGEDDGNLITLKNGILNDDTYDINDGNQKLVSFPEVTHVSSTNSLIPKVEADVIKGEESTPLEKLGTKLVTDGTEIVEFTKIKGKTLQNLAINPVVNNSAVIYKNNICEVPYTASNLSGIVFDKLLKPNTTYTYIMNVLVNDIDNDNVNSVKLQFGDGAEYASLGRGVTGMVVAKITTSSNVSENFGILVRTQGATSGRVKFQGFIVLEGDYTTTPLEEIPFVEGIKSVGETENNIINLTSVGKNLISKDMYTNNWFMGDSVDVDRYNTTGKLYSIYGIKTFGRKPLTLSCNKPFNRMVFRGKDSSGNIIYQGDLGTISKTSHVFNDIPSEVVTLDLYVHSEGIDYTYDFMLEEGKVVNPYEPYKVYNQNIYLKEPLRSLPNGVCDEIVGNKVIRRVGKVVLNGTESWTDNGNNSGRDYVIFYTRLDLKNSTSILSDRFPCKIGTMDGGETYNALGTNGTYSKLLYLCIKRTELSEASASGVKSWLSSKPTTVYYELDTSVEEYLANVYEKESIKTYQLDSPLRSLPNGVKDEIKDGVLIRRVGERILNGSENWGYENSPTITLETITRFILSDTDFNMKIDYHLMPNDKYPTTIYYDSEKEGIYSDTTISNRLWIHILKTNLEAQDTTSLKKWLQSNPVKFLYELATPIETSLTEVESQSANFTYNRQFAEGNWLRELPNGVKDTVENGKVIRRTKKVKLTGSESWRVHTLAPNQVDTTAFYLTDDTVLSADKDKVQVISDLLEGKSSNDYDSTDTEGIAVGSTSTYAYIIKVNRSRLSTADLDGFKAWLTQNPITCIVALATPVEEALSTDNYMSYPCHDFNTYCGSMYVGEGRNYVISDNNMPSENTIVVETEFREIEGKAKVEDCKYKKNDEGYDTPYISSSSKNLLDISTSNILTKDYSKNYRFNYTESNNGFTISNNTASSYASIRFRVYLKAGVSYRIEYAQTGPYSFVDLNTLGLEFICNLNSNRVFKVTNSDYYSVNFYCTGSVSTTSTATFTDIRITEGETSVPFEPCNKTTKYLENTEENDIEDLRHQVSLTGFNYDKILNESFDKLLRGEL